MAKEIKTRDNSTQTESRATNSTDPFEGSLIYDDSVIVNNQYFLDSWHRHVEIPQYRCKTDIGRGSGITNLTGQVWGNRVWENNKWEKGFKLGETYCYNHPNDSTDNLIQVGYMPSFEQKYISRDGPGNYALYIDDKGELIFASVAYEGTEQIPVFDPIDDFRSSDFRDKTLPKRVLFILQGAGGGGGFERGGGGGSGAFFAGVLNTGVLIENPNYYYEIILGHGGYAGKYPSYVGDTGGASKICLCFKDVQGTPRDIITCSGGGGGSTPDGGSGGTVIYPNTSIEINGTNLLWDIPCRATDYTLSYTDSTAWNGYEGGAAGKSGQSSYALSVTSTFDSVFQERDNVRITFLVRSGGTGSLGETSGGGGAASFLSTGAYGAYLEPAGNGDKGSGGGGGRSHLYPGGNGGHGYFELFY